LLCPTVLPASGDVAAILKSSMGTVAHAGYRFSEQKAL
jgi:cation transporter-like permease